MGDTGSDMSRLICPLRAWYMKPPLTSAVWRVARVDPSPRLDTCSIYGIVQNDVLGGDVLDHINLAWVLANASHGKAKPCIERAVRDVDVSRVLLHADRVVSVVNNPAQKGDVVGIDGL